MKELFKNFMNYRLYMFIFFLVTCFEARAWYAGHNGIESVQQQAERKNEIISANEDLAKVLMFYVGGKGRDQTFKTKGRGFNNPRIEMSYRDQYDDEEDYSEKEQVDLISNSFERLETLSKREFSKIARRYNEDGNFIARRHYIEKFYDVIRQAREVGIRFKKAKSSAGIYDEDGIFVRSVRLRSGEFLGENTQHCFDQVVRENRNTLSVTNVSLLTGLSKCANYFLSKEPKDFRYKYDLSRGSDGYWNPKRISGTQ